MVVFPSIWGGDGAWDSNARFEKGDIPDPDEFEAFQKYLEDEGFIEEAQKHWSK
jgi:hypothetical protein